jgi:hypothetical protein
MCGAGRGRRYSCDVLGGATGGSAGREVSGLLGLRRVKAHGPELDEWARWRLPREHGAEGAPHFWRFSGKPSIGSG